jgi:hypothetical protein
MVITYGNETFTETEYGIIIVSWKRERMNVREKRGRVQYSLSLIKKTREEELIELRVRKTKAILE